MNQKLGNWNSYLNLDIVIDSLARHNAKLLELYINRDESDPAYKDSSFLQYVLLPAKTVNNTYNLRNNHLTLNKGSLDGVKTTMGVISHNGLVGIVKNISDRYSHVMSLLHSYTKISATVSPYSYPGTLVWDGKDYKYMSLEAIPKHVKIEVGDTIITSGYSTIFPRGLMIGTIEEFDIDQGSSNYNIKVALANDIPNERVVYLVKNILGEEQKMLEAEIDE